MRHRVQIFLTTAVVLTALAFVWDFSLFAQTRRERIDRLMLISGTQAATNEAARETVRRLRLSLPQAREGLWTELEKERGAHLLLARVSDVYGRLFTDTEIEALIEFYESAAGKKLASVQNQLFIEISKVTQQWGSDLAAGASKKTGK